MAGEDAAAAGAAAVKKPLKEEEEEEEDDDELDNVPLALSRSKKAGNASASKVKKEDDDDDEEDDLPISHSRAKKGNDKQKGTMNSNTKASKAKKEADSDDDDDFMPISHKKKVGAGASNAKASKVKKLKDEDLEDLKEDKKRKKRGGVNEGAIVPVKGDKVKKEKKVYELPGQKHDPPAERDPLRIFYESLYEQVPTSEMAAIWLMEWGLLPLDVARKVYEKKQGQKFKSPVKTIVSKRKPTSPTKKTPASSAMKSVSATKSAGKPTSQKKRKASSESEDDDDDDFVVPKAKTKRQKASS